MNDAATEVDAGRLIDEARRVYDSAGLVHGRTLAGVLDSALLLRRAIHLGCAAAFPDDREVAEQWPEAVRRLCADNPKAHFVDYDVAADLSVVDRAVEAWGAARVTEDRALARDYDRVFARSAKLLAAFASEVAGRNARTAAPSPLVRLVGVAAAALVAGGLAGAWLVPHARGPAAPRRENKPLDAPATPSRAPVLTGLEATFFADETFAQAASTEKSTRLEYDWHGGKPPALSVNDHFSVRFTGTIEAAADTPVTFFLTSDDGSRLYVDDQPIVDNWGVHVLATQQGDMTLTAGKHRLRVEYFDGTGDASVKLEWASPGVERTVVEAAR